MSVLRFPVIVLLFFSLVSLSSAGEVRYEGSSTIGEFMRGASKVYRRSALRINTKTESSGGEQCVVAGRCDIGGVAREVKGGYLKMGAVPTLIGKDAIAVVVHKNNPVSDLSSSQLRGIFSGKIKNWKEVGGKDLPIKPFITAKNSATNKVFYSTVMRRHRYKAEVVAPDSRMIGSVSAGEGTIGQLSLALAKHRQGIKTMEIDGQPASAGNPRYPIARPLYLVTLQPPTEEMAMFIDWTLSPAGQEVVMNYFIGVR